MGRGTGAGSGILTVIYAQVMALSDIWHRMQALTAVFGMLLLSAGCVYEGVDRCPAGGDGEVSVIFKIAAQNTRGTRAGNVIGQETGTADENWIDMDGIRFLMFNGNGVFLQDLTAVADVSVDDETLWNQYTVRATFKDSYFSNPAFAGGNVPFKLMVLANWPEDALAVVDEDCSSAAVIEAAAVTFAMPESFFPELEGAGIPMYGLIDCSVPQASLAASTVDNYVDIGDIYMLRSLAKVEVIDNIADKVDGYPKLTNVSVMTWNSVSRLIPENFKNGKQVTSPTYPADPVPVSPDGGRQFVQQGYKTESAGAAYDFEGFTTYLPEIRTEGLKFIITVRYDADASSVKTHEIIPEEGNVWGTDILRNHIYRMSVNTASEVTLTYTVCPWDSAEITIPAYPEN